MKRVAVVAVTLAGCTLFVDTSDLDHGGNSGPDGGAPDGMTIADAALDATRDAAPCPLDLTADPKNCGRCGHDCLGGACVASTCRPIPFVEQAGDIAGVAVDATDIYWSLFDGTILSVHRDGSARRTVGKALAAVHIEVDDTHVYVATNEDKHIVRMRKDATGLVETLATCIGECLGVAVHAGSVYFTDRGSNSLRLIAPSLQVTDVVSGLKQAEDVSVNASRVLIANENANAIVAVPLGSMTSSKALSIDDPVAVIEDATDYWIVSQAPKRILRVPVGGGAVTTAATSPGQPIGLALTDDAVYWASSDGTIQRLAK